MMMVALAKLNHCMLEETAFLKANKTALLKDNKRTFLRAKSVFIRIVLTQGKEKEKKKHIWYMKKNAFS